MTQHIASAASFTGSAPRRVALQGINHGYLEKPARAREFALWKWFPKAILQHGGSVTRDDERAYRDLQAARDRNEWA